MTGKKQAEGLMNELLSFAEKMLNEHGEFHPFGGYLRASGAVVHVGVESSPDNSKSQQKIDALIESFKQLATQGKAIAFGIAVDVKLPRDDGSKSDAIEVLLEHQEGYCAEVFFRYEIGAEGVEVTDTIAQQGERIFFTPVN
ncbi:hypothetical protein ACFQZQ_11870 [Lysobacter koreensis]|uniref:Uncharacterized protein n=1 Tax=Lysobacter koreensis TaxID=266122 RepID=A0ABW2YNJ7_9GAMM